MKALKQTDAQKYPDHAKHPVQTSLSVIHALNPFHHDSWKKNWNVSKS